MEIKRARKALDAFCERRNLGMRGLAKQLCCVQDGDDLLLMETRLPGVPSCTKALNPLVRVSYCDGGWKLFCPDQRGGWAPYPHLPYANSIDTVIKELEQAPLHIHW